MASKHVAEENLDRVDAKRIKQTAITLGPYPGPPVDEEEPNPLTPPTSPSTIAAGQIRDHYQPKTRSLRQAAVVTIAGSERAVNDNCGRLGELLGRWDDFDLVFKKAHKTTLREITSAVSSTQLPKCWLIVINPFSAAIQHDV